MSDETTLNKDNNANSAKMLYKVLCDEYEKLEIISKDESIKIENFRIEAKERFGLKSKKELEKIEDEIEHEKESRRQLEQRGKYNAQILREIRRIVHAKDNGEKPKALCFSGGGIRSATFNLGILQGLARHGFLDKFDYLSTVSGGGYIGSWLSAWINRTGNVEKVQAALSKDEKFESFFGLADFKLICDEEKLADSLKNINELKVEISRQADFFGTETVRKLSNVELPEEYFLEQKPSEIYKLREFAKELTKQLNRIIGNSGEEPLKIKRHKDLVKLRGLKRSEKKRVIFQAKLAAYLSPPGDAEIIEQHNIERHTIEPEEVTHLRSFSNYMSPRIGLFSTDTWTLLGVYLRNLLLNWTVFVPFIAAVLLIPKIAAALFGLEPTYGMKLAVLIGSVIAGLIGVCNLNAMRPTLSEVSWVEQNYEVDDIGSVISVEWKVLRWGILPLVIFAVGITYYWFSIKHQPLIFPKNYFLPDSNLIVKILPFVLFSVILFVGGYLAARGAAWFFRYRNKLKNRWQHFFEELFLSIACGIVGGSLLYLVVSNLSNLSAPVYKFFGVYAINEGSISGMTAEIIRVSLYVSFGAPLVLIVFLLTATVFVGAASRITDDMDREWMARFGGLLLIIAVGWSAVSGLVLFGPAFLDIMRENIGTWGDAAIASIGSISGLITLILGFSKKSESETDKEPKSKKSFLLWFAPQVAAPIFAVFLMLLIVYVTQSLMNWAEIHHRLVEVQQNFAGSGWSAAINNFFLKFFVLESFAAAVNPFIWVLIFALIVWVMGKRININKFSLHAAYRERLIRAYLGASRSRERLETANSFTGLDNGDNVEMKELVHKPFHVVNMTLNLASSSNLRWQQRKAESFTATALHCGSSNMGSSGNYRSSKTYAHNPQNDKSITLGTAAAISGAAASPNMGYFTSSAAVSFLMALFNIRLGWWLGNTGKRGDETYNLAAPSFSLKPFIDEAFGRTNDTNQYIYLTDGGHFDNIGLYEMVLRRCHLIIVCDAACDANFEFFDFGSAIHKIRVDMGIPIEFEKGNAPMQGRNCGIATIKYSEVDGCDASRDGTLIYIKPTLDGDESIDLINYKKSNTDFPHESTADQMYSETQFESYRKLGAHMINSLCCQAESAPCKECRELDDLKSNAQEYLKNHPGKNETELSDHRTLIKEFLSN